MLVHTLRQPKVPWFCSGYFSISQTAVPFDTNLNVQKALTDDDTCTSQYTLQRTILQDFRARFSSTGQHSGCGHLRRSVDHTLRTMRYNIEGATSAEVLSATPEGAAFMVWQPPPHTSNTVNEPSSARGSHRRSQMGLPYPVLTCINI